MPAPLPGLKELPHLCFMLLCTRLYGWYMRCMSHTEFTRLLPITSSHWLWLCLRHAPLVSRYFSEICRDPSLWPELCVLHASFRTEEHWQSFARWLAVRASGLHTSVFCYTDCWVRTRSFVLLPHIKCSSA